MALPNTVEFVLGGVPFVVPATYIVREESNASLDIQQLPPDSLKDSLPVGLVTNHLSVFLAFATGTEYFLNSYGLFKGAIEALAYLQTIQGYPDMLKFTSYTGINEFMYKGQLQSFSFSSEPNSHNMVNVMITFERREKKSPIQNIVSPTQMSIPTSEGGFSQGFEMSTAQIYKFKPSPSKKEPYLSLWSPPLGHPAHKIFPISLAYGQPDPKNIA